MKRFWLLVPCLAFAAFFLLKNNFSRPEHEVYDTPGDYLLHQRAFPYDEIPSEAYYTALEQARQMVSDRNNQEWTFAGPTNVSGRITDLVMHPSDPDLIYAASASGGVWKTTDRGYNWSPIADALPTLSIGDLALDPVDKNTLYCGTGEANAGGGSMSYDGRGLFKTTDGGSTWASVGLEQTGSIARIEVDPQHPQRLFVAAMGNLFGNNAERGLFRSENGGLSWEKVLFVNDSTGAVDIVIRPDHPDTLYAAMWQRVRRPSFRAYGGPGSGIYRSTDGGDTWTKLQAGLPAENLGRIGLAIAATTPDLLYATIADPVGNYKGVYKTTNGGNNWTSVSGANPTYSNFGWWFGQIRVHPGNADIVYNLGVDWKKTTDGGQNWVSQEYLHADNHALALLPDNPDFVALGNDGGVYISENNGQDWRHCAIPVTQFYTSEIDFLHEQSLSGGAQDNSTVRTLDGGLDTWEYIWGGDGFVTREHPVVDSVYFAEYQYGGFGGSNGAFSPDFDRSNWKTPYILSPINPDVMYFGANQVFRSDDRGLTWTPVSNDLGNGFAGAGGVVFGTITALAASPLDSSILWAGTDDGNVWVTADGGANWTKVSSALPLRWITHIEADPFEPEKAYVCLSGYRYFDNMTHVYRTTDLGQHWMAIGGNLPDVPVNDLIVDPLAGNVLYLATDAGVFVTENGGAGWSVLGTGLPNAPITDLTLHAPSRTLAAATYGRAMFKTQLSLPVGAHTPAVAADCSAGPNPVSGYLHLQWNTTPPAGALVAVTEAATGRMVYRQVAAEWPLQVDARFWDAGIYVVSIQAGKQRWAKKVVVAR